MESNNNNNNNNSNNEKEASSTTTAFSSPPVTAGSAVLVALRICFSLRLNHRLLPRPPRRSPALTAGGSPRPGRQRHLRATEGRHAQSFFRGAPAEARLPVLPGGERRSSGTGGRQRRCPRPLAPLSPPRGGEGGGSPSAPTHRHGPAALPANGPRSAASGQRRRGGERQGEFPMAQLGQGRCFPHPFARPLKVPALRPPPLCRLFLPPRTCHCPPLPPPPPPRRLRAARRLARRRAAAIFGEGWGDREGAVGSGPQCACAEPSRAGERGRRPEGGAGARRMGVVCEFRGCGLWGGRGRRGRVGVSGVNRVSGVSGVRVCRGLGLSLCWRPGSQASPT